MKKLAATLLSLAIFLTCTAQDTLFTYDIKPAAGGYDILQVADEKNNKLYVFMKSKKSIEGLEIDLATNQLAAQITEKKEDESVYYNYYGALVNNRVVQLIFDGAEEDKFRILNFDFNTKQCYLDNPGADGLKQREVQAFVFNNEFYYLKLKARGSEFVLHKLERDRFSKSTFDFSNDFPGKQTVFDVLTTPVGMTLIPYRDVVIMPVSTIFENDISEMTALRKLYFYDDKIFITADDRDLTHIWEMMPQNNQVKYHRVDKLFMKTAGDAKVASNSHLYGNMVFQVQSMKDQVGVRAYDLATASSRIFFATDSSFVKKMYGKRAAISVMGFPDVLKMRLGGERIQTYTTVGGGYGSPSATTVTTTTPFGARRRPGTPLDIIRGGGDQRIQMTLMIDPVTFEEVNKRPEMREDKINSYSSAHITEIGAQEVTRLKERDIYSYYNKKDKKLVVLEFKK